MARTSRIDYRIRVGTDTFRAQPAATRRLMLWRRAHMFGGHAPVRAFARARGVKQTNKLSQRQLESFIRLQEV